MVTRDNSPERRLPPKVLARKKTGKKGNKSSKRRKQPWYRHAPWIISLAACGVFIVLIGGFFGVRQVVIIVRESNSEVADEAEEDGTPKDVVDQVADQKKSADPELTASLESSEPGMEVLPPKAAMQPGRKLPKMLLVGRRPQMFQSLQSAIKFAVPGDIIEIRTNRPMLVGSSELKVEKRTKGVPLTIRAGKGYRPVLRASNNKKPMIQTTKVDVQFAGLHFTTATNSVFIGAENCDVRFESCTFLSISSKGGGRVLSVLNSRKQADVLHVEFDRCLVKRISAMSSQGHSISVLINQSAFLYSHPRALDFELVENHSVQIQQSTFVNTYLLQLKAMPEKDWPTNAMSFKMNRSIFGILACCPQLVNLLPSQSQFPKTPAGAREMLRRSFREFHARDNIAQFWGMWASVSGGEKRVFDKGNDFSRISRT